MYTEVYPLRARVRIHHGIHELLLVVLGAVSVLAAPRRLTAQDIRGSVVDSVTRSPVRGAVLTLLDSTGRIIGRNITNDAGQFRLAGVVGARTARVTRIGFRPRTVTLATDGASLTIGLTAIPTLLEAVQVRTGARCDRRDDRAAALSLLEQARAGLLAAIVARDLHPTMVRLTYHRALGDDGQILSQRVHIDSSDAQATSFFAVRPAAEFVEKGFAFEDVRATTFFGPDAETLLDDAFRDGYCFELARPSPDRARQIGLRFVPAGSRHGRIDINGTLWIDTTARELREITFEYVGLPPDVQAVKPGGRIGFRALASGVTFIESWDLRLPAVGADTSFVRGLRRVRYYFTAGEDGGVVASAAWSDGARWRDSLGIVRLRPTDAAGHPAHALIQLEDTDYFGVSDSAGIVEFQNLLPGPYHAVMVDTALDRIGVQLPSIRFSAERGVVAERAFVAPTLVDFIRRGCVELNREAPDSTVGWFVGRLYDSTGSAMRRTQWVASRRGASDETLPLRHGGGVTGSDGLIFGCGGVETGETLTVRVRDPESRRWFESSEKIAGRTTVIRVEAPRSSP